MDTLVFDIEGDYALFRKPYSPMSPVSFPFPPPTAVLGLLGAIGGYGKAEYHSRLGWDTVKIAVALLAPVRVLRAGLNLLNTKQGATDPFFRPRRGSNNHIQIPCEFLRSPAFRIYAAGLRPEASDRIAGELAAKRSRFTPSLGLAQCFADIRWVGRFAARRVLEADWTASTVVPLVSGIRVMYEDDRIYQRLKVPASMDGQRVVHRYQEVVVAEDAGPIRGSGTADPLFGVSDATVAFL